MKTKIKVGWLVTVEVEVDPIKMEDSEYQERVRQDAEKVAWDSFNHHDSMITDCEDFPELCE